MGTIHISRNVKSKTQLRDYSNPGPIKTTNNIHIKLSSEIDNSESLHPSNEQGDSINMSSSNDEGGVTAVIATVRYTATKNQAHWRLEQPSRHCTSDQILRNLLDSGSDGDLMFHKKEQFCTSPT